jgi:type IV secretory pathway VirB6-like protein
MHASSLRAHRTLFVVATLLAIATALPAWAISYFDGYTAVTCPYDEGFTFQIVVCFQTAVVVMTVVFLAQFSLAMQGIVLAVIALQVTLHGVQMASGTGEVKEKSMALLLKIAFVLAFSNNLAGFAPDVFDIMEEAQDMVIGAIGTPSVSQCDLAASAATPFSGSDLWISLDCILDKLLKFSQPLLMYNSALALLSTALFSGSIGVMVFFAGIGALMGLLGYVFYAVYIFVISYLFVAFLIIISPLMVPLILVGASVGMFEIWLRNIIAGMAIPLFVFAYLAITMPLLDHTVFQDDESIQKVLVEDYSPWYRNRQQACSQRVGTDPDNYKNVPATGGYDYIGGPLRNILTPMMSGSTDYCALFGFNSLDFGEKHVQKLMDIADALIRILFVAYILSALMKQMASLGAGIFGAGTQIASVAAEGLPFESALRRGMGGAQNTTTKMIGGTSTGKGLMNGGLIGALRGLAQQG